MWLACSIHTPKEGLILPHKQVVVVDEEEDEKQELIFAKEVCLQTKQPQQKAGPSFVLLEKFPVS